MAVQTIQMYPAGNAPAAKPAPSVTITNRLESRPRTKDFERVTRAEVRDPLWMLTRQWHFGEFKGEDTGSAVFANLQYSTKYITGYSIKGPSFTEYDDKMPLETLVEREQMPLDLTTRVEMGNYWFRLLSQQGFTTTALDSYKAAFIAEYPFNRPETITNVDEKAQLLTNLAYLEMFEAIATRTMDGGALYLYLKAATANKASHNITVTGSDKQKIEDLGIDFVEWYEKVVYNQPGSSANSAWSPTALEYNFKISTQSDATHDDVLEAKEYSEGNLDWFAFEKSPNKISGSNPSIETKKISFIPSKVTYSGMPNARYWEFEDGFVDYGKIDAATTDIAKILLAEFSLAYGNDWHVIPCSLPVGSITEIDKLVIRDSFGQLTGVNAAGSGADDDWQRWSMYNLSVKGIDMGQYADNRLFLAPTIAGGMESPPIEKINFIRDEMANMVWGIEKVIPDGLGGGRDGGEAGRDIYEYYKNSVAPGTNLPGNNAPIEYELMTSVPENWIPFIPVNLANPLTSRQIQLQRGAMPRFIKGIAPAPVRPRSYLLTEVPTKYYINEEEIPRAGTIVKRAYQRIRWYDGKTYVWVGRKKETGRGEGNSRLKFDQISPKS